MRSGVVGDLYNARRLACLVLVLGASRRVGQTEKKPMAQLIRLSVYGTMPSGEEWSVNPCFSLPGAGVTVSPAQIQAVAVAAAAVSVPSTMMVMMVAACDVTGVRAEARSIGGALESQADAAKAAPQLGTGTGRLPFQAAWVLSLRTAAVGARGRGRLYWPATGVSLSAQTLRPVSADVATYLTGWQTYLTNLRNAVASVITGADLAVWSRAGNQLNEVNVIQVGDVLDTQRRRRDALVETYQQTLFV